jgi:hypothetical protein
MHLIASWCLEAATLTTTMEHRGGQDNDDGAWVQLFWGEGWGGCGVFGDG